MYSNPDGVTFIVESQDGMSEAYLFKDLNVIIQTSIRKGLRRGTQVAESQKVLSLDHTATGFARHVTTMMLGFWESTKLEND